ncbi:MAG TPA: FtsX-like permease family protein [Rhodanobacteraceae bacterium]|nr:FtsX-like permease family protein [Rhodanobacteraceae bacterium]
MEIQPILSALRKHKIPATLVVLEIALACAVLCNAIFMIGQRVGELRMPNAIDQNGLVDISVNGTDPRFVNADIPRDLAALQHIAGAIDAAAITSVPFGKSFGTDSVSAKANDPDASGASRYMFTRTGPRTLGLRLLEGRFFNEDEYADSKLGDNISVPSGHVVIVTQSLAKRLWPGQNALGREMWMGDHDYTVIGVVANVARPGGDVIGHDYAYYATFFPLSPDPALTDYLVRTTPGDRTRVLHAAIAKLHALSPQAVIAGQTLTEIRDSAFANIRSTVWMLVQVCLVMLAVTAFSIVGLSSFWVGQRRKQIGIRRALGGTRAQIAQYFQTENFLLSTAGVAVGMILAYGANLYLLAHYQLDHMPWYYLPASAAVLWILGQLAVLGPALRAAAVPPVVATRST